MNESITKNNWSFRKLSDLIINLDNKRKPVSSIIRSNIPGIFPYYGASGIVDYVNNYIFDEKLLLVSEDGENLKTRKTPIAFFADGKYWVNNHAHVLKNKDDVDLRFIKYWFDTNSINEYISGSVQPKLSKSNLDSIDIFIPSLQEQQKIAKVLSSLDDKIDLSRKINDNLEKIASSLFKRWFVDFEFPDKDGRPYKSSGGKMIDSELEEIPDGWEVLKINGIANIEYGRGEYSKIHEGKYSVFGAGGLVGYSDNYEYENQQLIVGCRGTCGNINITDQYVTITHNSLIIRPKEKSNFNIYSLKKSLEFSGIKSVITGSTQPQITIKDLSSLLILKPRKALINLFNDFIINSEKCILDKNNEIKKLEQARDSLLPKLMSGKIRV